ncbi:VC_2705 family sodium/solute symporter [Caldimonas sp. KR1-144]|uniref:VC_2705 family sodium/solute symporter n=1 Tax=Caldimonas sp. KR1-144 TaxID=3400911 RepID=UPI003BFB3879
MRDASTGRLTSRQLHRRYALYTLGLVLLVLALGLAERAGLSRGWIGGILLAAVVLVFASIGFASRTVDEVEYYVAGRRVPAFYNGMATAADWMSAASFIGTAGILYLKGFAGLAFILGWTGGFCLVAMLLAPHLRRLGAYTIPDFLAARYGGVMPRLIGALAAIGVSFVYVVAQIYGVGLVTSHLTGFTFELGILVGLGGVLMCSFLGGMRAVTWTQVAQYILLILAYLVPVVWLSVKQVGHPVPMLAYGQQLAQVEQRERELLADAREREVIEQLHERARDAQRKLDDVPVAMALDARRMAARIDALRETEAPLARIQEAERQFARRPKDEAQARASYQRERDLARAHAVPLAGLAPQSLPFAAGGPQGSGAERAAFERSRRNFLALVFCLMVGTAAMPHVLTRCYTTPTVAEARSSVGWALLFIGLLYVCAPALAVMVKWEVFSQLVGMPIDQLPTWLRAWAKADPSLVRVEDVNGDGLLQLAELWLGGDVIVLAAPEIGGLPHVITALVAAGGLAAALSTADGLLLTISNAMSHDLYHGIVNPQAAPVRRVMMSKMLLLVVALAAAAVAALRVADILQFVAAAFSLAASAFFPALVAGIYWRRATRAGATCGMLAGLAATAGYMALNTPALRERLGLTPFGGSLWWDIDPIAAGVFGVPVGFAVLVAVSLVGRAPQGEEAGLAERLRGLPGAAH